MSHSSIQLTSASRWSAVVLLFVVVGLTGCTANFGDIATSGPAPVTSAGTGLQGRVHGGNQPVVGSTIQLWGVGTTGYGSAATPLIASPPTTDQNGGFSITGDYTCPTSNLVYLTATSGNPGLGGGSTNNNAGLTLMAALGSCSTLKANAGTTFLQVNEVTTVAAIWALQQFASTTGVVLSAGPTSTTPSDSIGTTLTNIQGLTNAMNLASVLASNATGLSPGADTSGNQTNVEYWQVNTLADILAPCVNTNGANTGPTSPTACYTLFSNTNNATDTFQAALYMAQHPNSNVTNLVGLVGGTGAPFQPTDASTNDFTIGLSYNTAGKDSRWIAIDQFGNAWVTTSSSAVLELDPTGNIIANLGTFGSGSTAIKTAYEVAIDTANNPWFTDNGQAYIFEEPGSLSAGVAGTGTGTGYSTSAISASSYPEGIAIDGSNNVFASISSAAVAELASGGSTVTAGGSVGSSPFMIAVDLSNQATNPNYTLSNHGSFLYTMNSGGCTGTSGIKINGSSTTTGGGSIGMLYTSSDGLTALSAIGDTGCTTAATQVATVTTGGHTYYMSSLPYGIAFDNSNNMWIVNQNYTSSADNASGTYSLTKVAAQNYSLECSSPPCTSFSATTSATAVTPTTAAAGLANFTTIPGAAGGLNVPYYLAMDGASAAWVANSAGAGVSAFTNAGANISPATGFSGGTYTSSGSTCTNSTTTCQRYYKSSRGIAVDGSGNVWVANTGATQVTVLVGAASPTVTPLSLGIKNGTLASKP